MRPWPSLRKGGCGGFGQQRAFRQRAGNVAAKQLLFNSLEPFAGLFIVRRVGGADLHQFFDARSDVGKDGLANSSLGAGILSLVFLWLERLGFGRLRLGRGGFGQFGFKRGEIGGELCGAGRIEGGAQAENARRIAVKPLQRRPPAA